MPFTWKGFSCGFAIFFNFLGAALSLSCHELKNANNSLRVEDLKLLKTEAFFECLPFFGKVPLADQEGKFIWNAIVKNRGGTVQDVTDSDIRNMGWIQQHIPAADMGNLTLNEVDTIAALGQYHNLSEAQLQVLGERVLEDWAGKESSDYTNYDLMTLQHILCGFNRTIIEAVHPDAFKDAAAVLSTLRGCPEEALEALAELAMSGDAYGPTTGWISSQVKNVGCIINGLSGQQIALIPPSGIETLTPDIIPCLLPETIKAMTKVQLSHLTPSAVAALSQQQQAVFSNDQQRAVAEAFEGAPVKKSGTSNPHSKPGLLISPFIISRLAFRQYL